MIKKKNEKEKRVIQAAYLRLGDVLLPRINENFEKAQVKELRQRTFGDFDPDVYEPYKIIISLSSGHEHLVWPSRPYLVLRREALRLCDPEDY